MRARTLIPLLFLSGAAALVLEVAWFRRTAQIAGGTAVAMAAVLAAVIGGMAAGSFLLGRTADRVRSPVRLYAILEAGVAAGALLTPWLLTASEGLFVAIERHLGGTAILATPARFLLATILLAGPAVLMGGTLPAVAAAIRSAPRERGRGIGALYAANTLGAVAGTVAAGFLLIPALGLAWTTRSAAVLSGLAAAGAFALSRRAVTHDAPVAVAPETPPVPGGEARRAVILYAVSGFLGLVAEVAFARSLVLVFGSTTYAFSTMLAVFLLGIGAGSILGGRLAHGPSGHRRRLETTLAVTAALFSLSALVVYLLPRLYLEMHLSLGQGFAAGIFLRFVLALLVLLPGSLGLGVAFPLAVHLAAGERGVGAGTGRLYAANTVASILGSTLAVFAFVPLLGPQHTVAVVAVLAAGAALVSGRRVALAVLLLIAAAGLIPPPERARERLLAGVFFNPWSFLTAGEIDEDSWDLGADIPYVRHGANATVAVWRWAGHECLLVDGKAVASNQILADDHHLKLLGHLPMLIHPEPREVLVVGLGMGTTYEAVAAHRPDLLRVVEIESAVVETAAHLGIRPTDVVVADARTYLRATDRRFDVITSDPIHPWVRGGGDLYSGEYFEACKARLRPGGIVCQWLPAYQMGLEDVRDVVRTFTRVFRTEAYFSTQDLVLVGIAEGEVPDPRPFSSARVEPVLEPDLSVLRVAGHDRLVAAAGDGPILTDDALRLEFSTPKHMASPELVAVFAWIQDLWREPPAPYARLLDAEMLGLLGDGMGMQTLIDEVLRRHPDHGYAKRYAGETFLEQADYKSRTGQEDVAYFLYRARRLLGDDGRVVLVEADHLARQGDRKGAVKLLRRLIKATPDSRPLRRRLERLEGQE